MQPACLHMHSCTQAVCFLVNYLLKMDKFIFACSCSRASRTRLIKFHTSLPRSRVHSATGRTGPGMRNCNFGRPLRSNTDGSIRRCFCHMGWPIWADAADGQCASRWATAAWWSAQSPAEICKFVHVLLLLFRLCLDQGFEISSLIFQKYVWTSTYCLIFK